MMHGQKNIKLLYALVYNLELATEINFGIN